ncbi:Kef-type K+ transport system, predicted NAD-binding component [Singulisphaera acidiphila DSM 18658]|uniref:Kef-type K+ transport system, predicted NAD-binding component n=1 Tax=Singulisphaera acidiphila (strain ATCC BAA-1392 / DSM 18658 / VKM B-2454 / MOB10) TaxID=886293 RepID=L0DLX3_SINAD|nr:Kef-type K+ transport system, predicted NAD-binding component [Singulisphaera acidiphila DSM 18658]
MHDVSLILLITIGLAFALLFGAITNRLGLSPIVGYLLAGVMVGPYTPGFVGDPHIASQLAEMGVILLMFGVGLHFHVEDLVRVKAIAVPGAIVQITAATVMTAGIAVLLGRPLTTGLILGVAVSVASTVVLIRVLMDNGVMHTPQGHASVGWLLVEDLFTVVVLVVLPILKDAIAGGSLAMVGTSLLMTAVKMIALVFLVLVVGKRVLPLLMNSMARTRSRELFTLSVLVVALGVAAGSALVFGVSMALGAFLAGMVVGRSDVSHQAASDALPMRDAFAVLFFVSVGMLFNPAATLANWDLTLGVFAVIFIGKPLAALGIVLLLGYPIRTALTAAMALAQIGEFSFILGEEARSLGFLSEAETSVLVSCAIVSITVNPLIFRLIGPVERWLLAKPGLGPRLTGRSADDTLTKLGESDAVATSTASAVVVGYGPVGQTLTRILRDFAINPIVIDLNVDTVKRLRAEGIRAIYGDSSSKEILSAAKIEAAEFLLVTLPDRSARTPIIATALSLNPDLKVLVRAHYISERETLEQLGVAAVAYEEAEVAVALAEMLLQQIGVSEEDLQTRAAVIRNELALIRPRAEVH